MPRRCAVPHCNTGRKADNTKVSFFRVPNDNVLREKWEHAIPGVIKLERAQVICEKHFNDSDIAHEWIKRDSSGQIIAQVTYKRARLNDFAVPSKFDRDSVQKKNVVPSHEYSRSARQGSSALPLTEQNANLSIQDEPGAYVEYAAFMKPSVQVLSTLFEEFPETENLSSYTPLPAVDVETLPSLKNADSSEADVSASQMPFEVLSPVGISERIWQDGASGCKDRTVQLPESWSVTEVSTPKRKCMIFSYAVTKLENDVHCPLTERYVTLDANRSLKYFIYGRHVKHNVLNFDPSLKTIEMLPDILTRFRRATICNGLGDISMHFMPIGVSHPDCMGKWRSEGCRLVCKKTRCDACAKMRKLALQRRVRQQNRLTMQRIRDVSNPLDRVKLIAMRIRNRREKRQKLQAKRRVDQLMSSLKEQASQIAAMKSTTLDAKCAELNVPASQKTAIHEIIAAASKANVKGRRYDEEWLMLCMLMNIRSPGYYEFLRKNNILPLPCTRTIRSYFSLIKMKCGFDEDFAKLLEKHFASKTPLQRHGVLLLDEINLRKSVAVCSRNLTYTGLTDFGDDGPKSTDINDQATHGLVLMFQPLADSYTQPIAVFASKNPVKGDELAKLVVTAISYLEKCGAMIHGVIADGATTNAKMWSILDVRGTMKDTKSWFTHPLDDERKVFAFSDICHVFKNIRNRLYNKKKLRLKSTDDYVSWEYFNVLFSTDINHPGNARQCPKITNRHVILDNTSKMRVRLATQIFSNTVATGLEFYLSHGCEGFRGCEQTVSFCRQLNNMFDALNRKMPNQGLTPHCQDFKVLQDSLQWLNDWESAMVKQDIPDYEFLTQETSRGLRISLQSTMDLCRYLIDKYDFRYLLSGKLNQDNLEKFFGTIRQCAGCNDHPSCPTFLQLYKVLSVYSAIRPPRYGNCTVSENSSPPMLFSISDIEKIYGKNRKGKSTVYQEKARQKLDEILQHGDWEADDVIDCNSDHDYARSSTLDCIIYYVTGVPS